MFVAADFSRPFRWRVVVALSALGGVTGAVPAMAQTQGVDNAIVEFTTNVGSFEVELNPTDEPALRPLVQNFLRYVQAGRYDGTVINRLVKDFVVQMGEFNADVTEATSLTPAGFTTIPQYDPVMVDADYNGVLDFDTSGLSNTRGTVSMALDANDLNSARSSFFVNMADNPDLDSQGYVPFARVVDMSVLDHYQALINYDMTFRVAPRGRLDYSNVPFARAKQFLVIEQARSTLIPEPTAAVLAAFAAVGVASRRGRS